MWTVRGLIVYGIGVYGTGMHMRTALYIRMCYVVLYWQQWHRWCTYLQAFAYWLCIYTANICMYVRICVYTNTCAKIHGLCVNATGIPRSTLAVANCPDAIDGTWDDVQCITTFHFDLKNKLTFLHNDTKSSLIEPSYVPLPILLKLAYPWN